MATNIYRCGDCHKDFANMRLFALHTCVLSREIDKDFDKSPSQLHNPVPNKSRSMPTQPTTNITLSTSGTTNNLAPRLASRNIYVVPSSTTKRIAPTHTISTAPPTTTSTNADINDNAAGIIDENVEINAELINNETDEATVGIWSRAPTLFLLETYKSKKASLDSGKLRKKHLFQLISTQLAEKDEAYIFTPEQVMGRWKTLCRNYRCVKDNNNKSGAGRKDFPYLEEMDSTFQNDPAITPTFTLNTGTKDKRSTECDLELDPEPKPKRRSASTEVLEFLSNLASKEEERRKEEMQMRERMHTEKMNLLKSLLETMKK